MLFRMNGTMRDGIGQCGGAAAFMAFGSIVRALALAVADPAPPSWRRRGNKRAPRDEAKGGLSDLAEAVGGIETG